MSPDEIAALVLDQHPELIEKWSDRHVRTAGSGVTWWVTTRNGR